MNGSPADAFFLREGGQQGPGRVSFGLDSATIVSPLGFVPVSPPGPPLST
ncbi:hypothetical protein [Streptomyces sp. SYSU K217416]